MANKVMRKMVLCHEEIIIYTIALWRGHVFRIMPDGRICRANNYEKSLFRGRFKNNEEK